MTPIWNRLQSTSLVGPYVIQERLGESSNAVFFRIAFGEARKPAVLKVLPEEVSSGAAQLELWRCVARLSHPHLLGLLDCGRAELEGEPFLYAVFEHPDETLAGVASLSVNEARDIKAAVMDALRYIHSQGFVHTAVDPEHIVAVGNQIKLASDTLSEPSSKATTGNDIKSLNALIERLTPEEPPKPPQTPSAEIRETPPPLPVPLPPLPAQPPTPKPVPESHRMPPIPKWAYLLGLVFLAVLGYVFLPKNAAPPPAAASPPSTAPGTSRALTVPSPTAAAAPPPISDTAPAPAQKPPSDSVSGPSHEYWRVIAYTYARYSAAEQKARAINARWDGAQAEVFRPTGVRHSHYLVTLGGHMTRDEAVRFLKIARGKGMPRDTYIQNYSR